MEHELDGLKGMCSYKGVTITKLIGQGYMVLGEKVANPHEVDLVIERAGNALKDSIVYPVTVKGGSDSPISCFNADFSQDNSKVV